MTKCLYNEKPRYKDISGMRFGSLIAIKYLRSDERKHAVWLCKCDCGKEAEILGYHLLNGHTTTCGHSGHKASGEHLPRDNPRLYQVWLGIKARCYNPNNTCYHLYGAKGVSLCEEWKTFKPFYEWAIANGYDETAPYGKCTLDRINGNGNYTPNNCRWVNAKVQSRNRKNIMPITFNGKTQLMTDWANELGIPLSTLYVRLQNGWSVENALTVKPRYGNRVYG